VVGDDKRSKKKIFQGSADEEIGDVLKMTVVGE
jgi:hypothetical protein